MSVKITNPAEGATVKGVVRVTVDAPGVKRINFVVDGVIKGRDTQAPFAFDWYTDRYTDGRHSVKAVAGSGHSSDTVTVTVANTVTPPPPPPPPSFAVSIAGTPRVGQTLKAEIQ